MVIIGCLVALAVFCVPSDSIRIHSFQWVPGWQNRLLASPELSSPVKVYSLLHCTSMCSIQRCKLFFYNVNVRSCYLLWRELTNSDSFIASFGTKAYYRVLGNDLVTIQTSTPSTTTTTKTHVNRDD